MSNREKTGLRILHTGDLHLGLTIHGFDRSNQQRDMLRQIADIAAEQQVDAIVISGDIYHTAQPPTSATRIFSDTLFDISQRCNGIAIVATAGNHDSPTRHESHYRLWSKIGATMIGTKRDENNLNDMIVEIPDKGFIIAVPYINQRSLPDDFYKNIIKSVTDRNIHNLPIVIMAHTAVAGADFSGHENASERTIGGIDTLAISSFGTEYDYLALGHIHKAQNLKLPTDEMSNRVARYAGTPLATSFDEAYTHTISIVDITEHGAPPIIEEIAITDTFPLVNIPTSGFADWQSVKKQFEDFPVDIPALIRLNVEIDDFLPIEAFDSAKAIAAGKNCKLAIINSRLKEREINSDMKAYTLTEFQALDPLDLAKQYLNDKGRIFSDRIEEMFKEATIKADENEVTESLNS